MKVYKQDGKIIFEFPESLPRLNPCVDDSERHLLGTYPTFTGLIVRHRKNGNDYDEIGFAGTIDMDYKDKGDQVSDFIVLWHDGEEEFIKVCKKLGINVYCYNC